MVLTVTPLPAGSLAGPRWEAVYIAAPTGWMLGPALADAALLSSGGLWRALR